MDHDHTFVMLDPTTDQVLAECAGPDARGRCPTADRPPYICAGLHLIGTGDGSGSESFTVTKMEPGRCPIAVVNEPQLTTLTREECLELLRGAVVGRIGYVADGMAMILPVNFALLDGDIVFCTAKGGKLSWLSLRERVTFEADESRPADHEGWSVLIRGVAREVTHPEELAVLRRRPPLSWLRSPHEHWMRISIEAMSGRALHGAPATDRTV
jgi:nitroimidazol reductase NimA-like FMN-containing flavoprotein (pyridoxamine 5'-phosphate oxidase superfamily)